MKVLAIETSCDETAIAIVSGEGERIEIDASLVFSQVETHAEYGGVIPEVAARMHLEKIFPLMEGVVPTNGEGIDAIVVTAGPGLSPALRTGVEVAKTLAVLWNKPLIPVSHMEGHIYANWIGGDEIALPALALVVSGGHTELVLMHAHGTFERIGETIDDAAGEAFDKVAQMLALPYPGGPAVAKLAERGNATAFDFPRGLLEKDHFDFSFSGLKTSVLYFLRKHEAQLEDEQFCADVAASFQEAVVDVLVKKTARAAKKYDVKSLLLAGGVSANTLLRARMKELGDDMGVPVHVPEMKYTMDNAAMVGVAGYFRAQDKKNVVDPLSLQADSNLDFVL